MAKKPTFFFTQNIEHFPNITTLKAMELAYFVWEFLTISHLVGKYFFKYFPLMNLLCNSPIRFANQYAFLGSTRCTLKGPSQLGDHLLNSLSLEPTGKIIFQTSSHSSKLFFLILLL